jgi:hypothetical protein
MYNIPVKSMLIFSVYFLIGFLLVFSYKIVDQKLSSGQLNSPLPHSSFSLGVAPRESLRGTVVSLSGEVGWQSRTATQASQIIKPTQIQQGEEIVTGEKGRASVAFSDKVNITINPATQINFIQTLPANILIGQNNGSAEYKNLNNTSLSVRSQDLLIKITRGAVDISVSKTQPRITIDVKEGSITAGYNDLSYKTQVLNAQSGNRLIFRTDTKRASLIPLQ